MGRFQPKLGKSESYLSNRPQIYRLINHADVGRTREQFVNHEPQASDLRILRVLLSKVIKVKPLFKCRFV